MGGGDFKPPGDQPGLGVSDKLFDKARRQVEQASRLLEKRGVSPRTPGAEGIAPRADTPMPSEELIEKWKDKLPPAHGVAQDVHIADETGHLFTLRTEDASPEQLREALDADRGHVAHGVRIRVLDGNREVGRANLTLEADKRFNAETGHYDRVSDCRVRLNDIEVLEKNRQRGIGSLMLGRAEEFAQQGGAREIYGTLDSQSAQPFFEKHGYQLRRGRFGGQAVRKALYH